jgi:hypothetical protein
VGWFRIVGFVGRLGFASLSLWLGWKSRRREQLDEQRAQWNERLRNRRIVRELDLDDQRQLDRERDAAWFQLWSRVNHR